VPTEPLRIVLCTSGGAFGTLVLRRLLASERVRVVGIVVSTRVLKARYGWLRGACEQIRQSGAAYAAYLWAATSLFDLAAAGSGAGSVAFLARRQGIPVFRTRDVNTPPGLAFVARQKPDLLLSAFFNQKLGAAVRAIPGAGAANIHPSLLPDCKGVDPVFFGRLRSAERFGVSLHALAEEFDAGAVFLRQELRPEPGESVFRTTARLFDRGAELLLENLESFRSGAPGQPQEAGGSYDSWPVPADVRALRRRGVPLIRLRDFDLVVRAGPPGRAPG
jgi:methionyl-tRNA formyltransferase